MSADDRTRTVRLAALGCLVAAKALGGLGCSVREVTLSPLADWAACGVTIMLSEAYAIHEANLRTRFTDKPAWSNVPAAVAEARK